jgi:hypothetical protein
MGNQEVSKPVMIAVIAVVVIVIGWVGWYYLMKPQTYPGFQAPAGNPAAGGSRMLPGMNPQQPGGPAVVPR